MGSYTFKWEHPAEEVFVTGTFDNWTKSIKLEKEGGVFQKTVELKEPEKKIYYKFVVDNKWTTNESAPKEVDHEGNENNFLTAQDVLQSNPSAAFISSVGPTSTTAKMAGEQPIEAKDPVATPSEIPGGFPATPANELDKPIGVNPLPAAAGAVNPVDLKPGEKIPQSVTAQGTTSNVKLDKESYEKSDALAGVDMTPPPGGKGTIPESGGIPMGTAATDATIATVGAGATTAALAGQVPLESKAAVPEVVKESQKEAGTAPEASAVPEEVKEKAAVEKELKEKVPEEPSTSEGTAGVGTEKTENTGGIVAAAATAGGAVLAAAIATKDSLFEKAAPAANSATETATETANQNLPDSVKEKLPVAAQEALAGQNKEDKREEVSPEVPSEVKESIAEAGKNPEAAANTAAVEDKKAVESELLKEVKPVPAEGEATTKKEEAVSKKEEIKEEVKGAVSTNGGSKNGESASGSKAAATDADKKKKHRLSSMFSKLKEKMK